MSDLPDVANNFNEFIKEGVVVVDFWATWCGPCRMLAPVLDGVAETLPEVKFGQVDVDKAPDLARQFNVASIPNVCIFKNGKFVDRMVGMRDADEIVKIIKKQL